MRHYFLIFIFLLDFFTAFSQNTGIGVGTSQPHPSAEFEISSTNKGFLPPRMTFAQRNAISSPAAGLVIWCSDCLPKGELQVFNGSEWTNSAGGLSSVNYEPLPSVTIGSQIWSFKNLEVANYRNGDPIPQVTDANQWAVLTTGASCWYYNDAASYAPTYGRLYNWYAVVDPRGLCPTGWHVPNDAEWTVLANQLGGYIQAGSAMKSAIGWYNGGNGTNSSGFTGLAAGYRYQNGNFNDNGASTYFWSTTDDNGSSSAWVRNLYYFNSNLSRNTYPKRYGFSVRCIRY